MKCINSKQLIVKVKRKMLLCMLGATSIFVTGIAQPGKKGSINISAGADALFPNSNFSSTHKTGWGSSVKA
jgi:hypothetical protein